MDDGDRTLTVLRQIRSFLFGMIYERHIRRCRDCYYEVESGGYTHCPRAERLWRRI